MPDHSSLYAIQFAPVPLNEKVARSPEVMARTALPPLCMDRLFSTHSPESATAASVCSTRCRDGAAAGACAGAGAGSGEIAGAAAVASKASTQTHDPPEAALLVPVASMATVWAPAAR